MSVFDRWLKEGNNGQLYGFKCLKALNGWSETTSAKKSKEQFRHVKDTER